MHVADTHSTHPALALAAAERQSRSSAYMQKGKGRRVTSAICDVVRIEISGVENKPMKDQFIVPLPKGNHAS